MKMLKENGKGATEVDDVVTMKSGNLLPSKEQPKKRSFSTSRLNELAKPKPKVRPRIQDDIQLPKKVQHKMKLESVLAAPPPLQKSTRPTTKVNNQTSYVVIIIHAFRLAHLVSIRTNEQLFANE